MSEAGMQLASDLYQRAREAMDRKELEEAIALFRCSAELCPHFKTLELLGECLLELRNTSESIIFLAAAAGLGNRAYRAFFLLARALSLHGEISSAIEKLDLAIELQPSFRAAIELRDELTKAPGR